MKSLCSRRSLVPLLALIPSVSCASLLGGGKPDNPYRFGIPAGDHDPGSGVTPRSNRSTGWRASASRWRSKATDTTTRDDGVLYIKKCAVGDGGA